VAQMMPMTKHMWWWWRQAGV